MPNRVTAMFFLVVFGSIANGDSLSWPLECPDGTDQKCLAKVGKPDVRRENRAHDCGDPGYVGHTGTDMHPTARDVALGTKVLAAAPGTVAFAYDGFFDQCPSDHPQCKSGHQSLFKPGYLGGYTKCSRLAKACRREDAGACFWCFSGNHVVITHDDLEGIFATAYLHLGKDSVVVEAGQKVERGDLLGLVASSGRSAEPHLHFEVWDKGIYQNPVDPWAGPCGRPVSLWQRKDGVVVYDNFP